MKVVGKVILYSKGVQAIADDLEITKDSAQDVYDKVMEAFPELKAFMEETLEFGQLHGYVCTYHGTKRRLPNLNLPKVTITPKKGTQYSDNVKQYWYKKIYNVKNQRIPWSEKRAFLEELEEEADNAGWIVKDNSGLIAESERRCVNSVVQGSSAYMIKKAMILLDNNEEFHELGGEIVIPIHDEILCQFPKDAAEEGAKVLEKCMIESAKSMGMEIAVDVSIEARWTGEMTEDLYKELHSLVAE